MGITKALLGGFPPVATCTVDRVRINRLLARLEQEPERPSSRDIPRMTGTRTLLFRATLAVYAVVVGAVLVTSPLVRLDWQVMLFRPYKQWSEIHAFLDYFVVLGQRGPTAVLVMAWLGWRSWRQRTLRPLLALGAALLLLNVTVGAVKYGLGRLGPHYATTVDSAELFAGGDIFPSGHTANAVVTWGILAYLATTPRARRVLSVVGATFSLGVGATTVYLGTHWVSDVLLGWIAGLLILLALPWCEPAIARVEAEILTLRERLRNGLAGVRAPQPGVPSTPSPTPATRDVAAPPGGTHPVVPAGESAPGGRTPTGTAARMAHPHHTGRAHPLRAEHGPVSGPARRPQGPSR